MTGSGLPLHVILRFEIESALINGTLEPEDIPDAWDERECRSISAFPPPGNYADGCLQDIHWTDGSFGYFPSYTLGALNGAQLFAALRREFPDWQDRLSRGEVGFVREWCGRVIWSKASAMDSQDILYAATGEGINPHYFLEHITARYLARSY